jgi:hypothetical protein
MTESPPGRARWARLSFTVPALLVWVALVYGFIWLAGNLAVRVWAAFDGFLPGYRWALILSSKTLIFAAVLIALVVFLLRVPRAARRRGFSRREIAAALVGVVVLTLGVQALQIAMDGTAWWGRNRYGFWRVWPASHVMRFDPRNGEIPYLWARTNAQSFRDDEWTIPAPDDGTVRALLVGDSTTYGLSLPENSDLLDQQLEQRLNAAGAERWDVWNIATAPASMAYYAAVIPRVARDARPRYAILFIDCECDFTFHDEQLALADKPDWFYPLARAWGLFKDLMWTSKNPWPYDYDDHAGSGVIATRVAEFERLLGDARAHDYHVVVWSDTVPCRHLTAFEGRPEVSFFSWRDQVGLSCGDPETCRFYQDPSLGHPSKHLTPLGMSHVAEGLAPELLRLEAERRARAAAPR